MGSPISAVIADLYMEAFEEQTLATAPKPPRKWKRYVDDTFTVMKQHNADNFRSHLNQQHPSIRFTMETENNNKTAFLDTLVTREPDGKLVSSVYRKPTHTDQYLAYDSHHPQSVKRGIVKCLHGRAKRIITKPSGTAQEIHSSRRQRLSSVLLAEGDQNQESNTREGNNRIQVYRSAAMLQRVLEPLCRHLQQQGIRTVFKSDTTLRPKDPADPNKQDCVVYKIPCTCGKVYVGETGRPMQERMKENDKNIRLARTQNSAVSEHANGTGHKPVWNKTKLIARESHWYTRKVKEAIHIRPNPNNINRDSGAEIPEAWTSKPTTHEKPANAWGNHGTWKQ